MNEGDYSRLELRTIAYQLSLQEGDIVDVRGTEISGRYMVVSADVMTLLKRHQEPEQTIHQGNPQVNKPWYRAMKHGNKYGRK